MSFLDSVTQNYPTTVEAFSAPKCVEHRAVFAFKNTPNISQQVRLQIFKYLKIQKKSQAK